MGRGTGGNAAGEGRVAVDVEFEEVEEGVGYDGDGAVEFYSTRSCQIEVYRRW